MVYGQIWGSVDTLNTHRLYPTSEKERDEDRQVDRQTDRQTIIVKLSGNKGQKTLWIGHSDLVAFYPILLKGNREPQVIKSERNSLVKGVPY